MSTPYCSENQAFSDAAHAAAERMVYPAIFPDSDIRYACQAVADGGEGQVNDGEKAIDYILHVAPQADVYAGKTHIFTVQERWRRRFSKSGFDIMSANDITITARNPTGQRSEWEKMQCQWMLYGFYCEDTDAILKASWVNVGMIRWNAVAGKPGYRFSVQKNRRSGQEFYSVPVGLDEVHSITFAN